MTTAQANVTHLYAPRYTLTTTKRRPAAHLLNCASNAQGSRAADWSSGPDREADAGAAVRPYTASNRASSAFSAARLPGRRGEWTIGLLLHGGRITGLHPRHRDGRGRCHSNTGKKGNQDETSRVQPCHTPWHFLDSVANGRPLAHRVRGRFAGPARRSANGGRGTRKRVLHLALVRRPQHFGNLRGPRRLGSPLLQVKTDLARSVIGIAHRQPQPHHFPVLVEGHADPAIFDSGNAAPRCWRVAIKMGTSVSHGTAPGYWAVAPRQLPALRCARQRPSHDRLSPVVVRRATSRRFELRDSPSLQQPSWPYRPAAL